MTDIPPLNVVLEAARLTAVRSYDLAAPNLPACLDEIVRLLASSYATVSALISLVDASVVRAAAQVGLPAGPLPRFGAFCQHVVANPGGLLVVEDATLDARFHMSPLVQGLPRIRAYQGVALIDGQGYALGAVGVLHTSPFAGTGRSFDGLIRASQQAAASLQAARDKLGFKAADVAKDAEWPSFHAVAPRAPALWIGIRTEGSVHLAFNQEPGRLVTRVAENSPASRAGVRVGDMLLDIDGHPMRRRGDIENRMTRHLAGDNVQVRLSRGRRIHVLRVRLDVCPREKHT